MYWVYEILAGQLHSRRSFTLEDEAIAWADKQKREWAKWGSERHYQVFYFKVKVYEN